MHTADLSLSFADADTDNKSATVDEAGTHPQHDLRAGLRVRVRGLTSNAEFNEHVGTLMSYDAQKDRWQVVLQNGTGLLAKPSNLLILPQGNLNEENTVEQATSSGSTRSLETVTDSSEAGNREVREAKVQAIVETSVSYLLKDVFCLLVERIKDVYEEAEQEIDAEVERRLRTKLSPVWENNHPGGNERVVNLPVSPRRQAILDEPCCSSTREHLPDRESPLEKRGSDAGSTRSNNENIPGTASFAKKWGNEPPPELLKKPAFKDAADVKAAVVQACKKPKPQPHEYHFETGVCQRLINSETFEHVTHAVVMLNAIWVAIDTDYNNATHPFEADIVFQVVENMFLIYFCIEAGIRFGAFKLKRGILIDHWFLFDMALVMTMLLETWIVPVICVYIFPDLVAGASAGGGSGTLKLFRVIRLMRLARLTRLLRVVPELMILVKAIFIAFRSVFFTLCLLMFIIYMFAIAFTQLSTGLDVSVHYFPNVPESIRTLLFIGNMPDHADFVLTSLDAGFFIGVLAVTFVILAPLTVMGMLAGVLIEVVGMASSVEKETNVVNYVNDQLRKLMQEMDADGDCTFDRDEFRDMVLRPEAARMMAQINVDVMGLIDFCDLYYLDNDTLEIKDFLDLVLHFRGTNTATVKDIVDLRKFVRNEMLVQTQEQQVTFTNMTQQLKEVQRYLMEPSLQKDSEVYLGKTGKRLIRVDSKLDSKPKESLPVVEEQKRCVASPCEEPRADQWDSLRHKLMQVHKDPERPVPKSEAVWDATLHEIGLTKRPSPSTKVRTSQRSRSQPEPSSAKVLGSRQNAPLVATATNEQSGPHSNSRSSKRASSLGGNSRACRNIGSIRSLTSFSSSGTYHTILE
eukprot:TRINITY_DN23888_c0_g1_i2.p1 TRINITY_DN23888_c0_g1~~TRINITY_DN23888_c0_g1_i2.p1  ORF type:complete len:860 (-),score=142.87 TRINITY_DN23888_c0_g1_i2:121-2700(-)